MKNPTASTLFVLALSVALGHSEIRAQGAKARESASIELLQSDCASIRDVAKKRILEERKKMISELVEMIDDAENHTYRPDTVTKSIETLGETRAVDGIDVLVKYIGYPFVMHPDAGEGAIPEGGGRNRPPVPFRYSAVKFRYPAAKALIHIGTPCIPKVIEKAAETESGHERRVCVAVLRELDPHSRAREAVQKVLDQEKNVLRRQHLQWVRNELAKPPEPEGHYEPDNFPVE